MSSSRILKTNNKNFYILSLIYLIFVLKYLNQTLFLITVGRLYPTTLWLHDIQLDLFFIIRDKVSKIQGIPEHNILSSLDLNEFTVSASTIWSPNLFQWIMIRFVKNWFRISQFLIISPTKWPLWRTVDAIYVIYYFVHLY